MDASGILKLVSVIGAGLCMGFGAIGPAMGIGACGMRGTEAMADRPEVSGQIMKTMLIAMAITESTAIYALVVAVLLLFGVE